MKYGEKPELSAELAQVISYFARTAFLVCSGATQEGGEEVAGVGEGAAFPQN